MRCSRTYVNCLILRVAIYYFVSFTCRTTSSNLKWFLGYRTNRKQYIFLSRNIKIFRFCMRCILRLSLRSFYISFSNSWLLNCNLSRLCFPMIFFLFFYRISCRNSSINFRKLILDLTAASIKWNMLFSHTSYVEMSVQNKFTKSNYVQYLLLKKTC